MHKRLVGLCLDVTYPDPRVTPEEAQCPVCLGHNSVDMLVEFGVVLRRDAEALSRSDAFQHLVVELLLVCAGSQLGAHNQDTALAGMKAHIPLLLPLS